MEKLEKVPRHIALIMDGNGRWAKARNLPKIAGHREGVKTAEMVLEAALEWGVGILTLYTFSTENWKRPKAEVDGLFRLLEEYLEREGRRFNERGIRFSAIGRIGELPATTQEKIHKAMQDSARNDRLVLNLALNYGGRTEIVDAARRIAGAVRDGALEVGAITEELFGAHLYTAGLPDPDLLIRTSGEFRLSNFLLWQLSYAEICITEKLWPEFTKDDFRAALIDFQRRERRYGG